MRVEVVAALTAGGLHTRRCADRHCKVAPKARGPQQAVDPSRGRQSEDILHGTPCKRISVYVDISRVWGAFWGALRRSSAALDDKVRRELGKDVEVVVLGPDCQTMRQRGGRDDRVHGAGPAAPLACCGEEV